MKRLAVLAIVVLFAIATVGCQYTTIENRETRDPIIAFVTSTSIVEDGSFNSQIIEGLKKATSEYQYDLKILSSDDEQMQQDNLTIALELEPAVIITDYNLQDTVLAIAEQYTNTKFIVADGEADDATTLPDNVQLLTFDNEAGAFLVGIIAASSSNSGIVGFIGGMDDTPVESAKAGFIAGARAVNPEMEVLTETIGSYDDAEAAGKAADSMHQQGADVVFGFAGAANQGVLQSAEKNDYWSIGCDQDQALVYPQMAQTILCSMVKNLDLAVYNAVTAVNDESFSGGNVDYGIDNGGIVLGAGGGNITSELQDVYNTWRQAIADGRVSVPATEEEARNFTAPAI